MSQSIDREVYDFLARKLLFSDRKKQKEVLMFWSDLIAADFERNTSAAGFDSDDKAYIRECVEKWFYNTLLDVIYEMGTSRKNDAFCRDRLRKIVVSRLRHIIKDLLFSRKAPPKEKTGERPGRKEKEKEPADSYRPKRGRRVGIGLSHLSPDVQDTVFADPFSDVETQYLCREILLSQDTDRRVRTWKAGKQDCITAGPASEDVGLLLARQAHLEALRVRLLYSQAEEA